jgi:anti-sigma regulatory factor (Ser/Thr protein kinase)
VIAAKTFDCTLETVKDVRGWIVDVLSAHKTPMDVIGDVVLATSEAVTNAVVHGYEETHKGRVDMSIQLSDSSVTITIRDYGSGLGRKPYTAPDTGIPHEGGYGVYLLHSLMDEVEVRSLDKGTEVRMKKLIKPNTES